VQRNYVEGLAWLIVSVKSGADGSAEEQVRTRLAKKPTDIKSAETRAEEILKDLPHANVRAVRTVVPNNATVRPSTETREKILPPTVLATPLEKTAIPLDALPKISFPVASAPSAPKPSEEKR
jgi:hypothetical protein